MHFTTGACERKAAYHQFYGAAPREFQACCSSCQVKGEISQCMGASPALKIVKYSFFLVQQWMRWILCSVAGELPGNLEFQDGLLDLLCSARLGFQPYALPGVYNSCSFSVFRLNLSGKIKSTHATPNCLWLSLCLLFLCPLTTNPCFYSLHQIYTQGSFSSEQSGWGLGELCTQNFPKILRNMLHEEHKAHFTIPC